jgi:hypothetical protein
MARIRCILRRRGGVGGGQGGGGGGGGVEREILSQVVTVVTMQSPSCHSQLPSRCLGVSDALLLKDGELIAVYERAHGFRTGYLGPSGSCQPAFQLREDFLDRPSREASAAAQVLVAEAIGAVRQLDWSHDRGAIDAIFLSTLRRILDGAGRGPLSPKEEGWIDVRANPALTWALAAFAVHDGVTVGQSVEAVAWAREGGNPLVYDARGQEAAAPFQPKTRCCAAAATVADGGNHQPLRQPERLPAATRLHFRTSGQRRPDGKRGMFIPSGGYILQ